jgi:hypothetical protein
MPDSGWMIAGAADNHDIRNVDSALFLNDAALDVLGRVCASMALEETDPFHDNSVLVSENA